MGGKGLCWFLPQLPEGSSVVSLSIARFADEVSAYASDLRLLGSWSTQGSCIEMNLASKVCLQRRLQQRLESAASHVFRVTSSQQAQVQTKCIRNMCTHVYNLWKCICMCILKVYKTCSIVPCL